MQPFKIVFSAINSQGHVNACIAIAELLAPRGHEIIFAVTSGWKEQVEKHNFKFIELVIDEPEEDYDSTDNTEKNEVKDSNGNNGSQIITNGKNGSNGDTRAYEKSEDTKNNNVNSCNEKNEKVHQKKPPNAFLLEYISTMFAEVRLKPMDRFKCYDENWARLHSRLFASMGAIDEPLSKILDNIKPDLVIIDTLFWLPCLMNTTIPWISLWSSNPLLLYPSSDLPPFGSGFPTQGPRHQWEQFDSINRAKHAPVFESNRRWLAKKGITVTEEKPKFYLLESPFLNIYNYPEILDYCDISTKPNKWFRVDSAIREPDENNPFEIPEKLANKPGKLIYFSLGSMGSVYLDLMKRVISCLAKSPHRFIVSKGPHHKQLDLPDNMWGERYVNQIGILPHVDLVITHGGNNTITESLYFGKPVIVMPLFFDQPDNAQRIAEKGLGLRIETFHFRDEELLEAIEKIFNDDEIYAKLSDISTELRSSNTREQLCELIEKTAILKKCPL